MVANFVMKNNVTVQRVNIQIFKKIVPLAKKGVNTVHRKMTVNNVLDLVDKIPLKEVLLVLVLHL